MKWIPGYKNLYKISKKGRVIRVKRTFEQWNNQRTRKYRRELSKKTIAHVYDSDGYPMVGLRKNGKRSHLKIHRLLYVTYKGIIPLDHVVRRQQA